MKIINNTEDGLAVHITKIETGFSIRYEDTDAGEFLPGIVKVKTLEAAEAKANEFVNGV